jgi:hypothetical protein
VRHSPNLVVARVLGVLYVLFGIALTIAVVASGPESGLLFGVFQANAAQNIVHVVLGIALIVLSTRSVAVARSGNAGFGAVLLVLGIVGLFLSGTAGNVLALNGAGNAIHFASAVVLLAVGLGAEKTAPRVTDA